MEIRRIAVTACLVAAGLCPRIVADGFTVRLGLKNGHIREVFFGCADEATDGYDRGLDDFAPPPGIETGYTAFVSNDSQSRLPPFYKDIRAPAQNVIWRFAASVYKSKDGQVVKPVTLSWDSDALPDGYEFILTQADCRLDMHTVGEHTVNETGMLEITVTLREQQGKTEPDK